MKNEEWLKKVQAEVYQVIQQNTNYSEDQEDGQFNVYEDGKEFELSLEHRENYFTLTIKHSFKDSVKTGFEKINARMCAETAHQNSVSFGFCGDRESYRIKTTTFFTEKLEPVILKAMLKDINLALVRLADAF